MLIPGGKLTYILSPNPAENLRPSSLTLKSVFVEELESQIAKIQLGGNKASNSYVYILAEKAAVGRAELYVIAELPLFNPAAEESCKSICLAISSSLKKAYRLPPSQSSFENAIGQVNEELGKLASLGQAQWINKLNCILGVKDGEDFNISTCGKIAAYLLRNGEYTDISCSAPQGHLLKIFETYATGKIRLGDLLILSTTQLFNYLSMDRLLSIMRGSDFLTATQTIIELLKENAEPQISFGVLLNSQVPPGQTPEEVDLENYIVEKPASRQNLLDSALNYLKTAFAVHKTPPRVPQTSLPKVSLGQRIKNFSGNTKNFVSKGKSWWQSAKSSAKSVKTNVNVENLRGLSPQKKFFLLSALILLAVVVINISVAVHYKKLRTGQAQALTALHNAQSLLSNAQASLLYKDNSSAANYLSQAKNQIPQPQNVPAAEKSLYNQVLSQLQTTEGQMEKLVQATVTNLGSLGAADRLIKLPAYLGVQVGQAIISYNLQTQKIEDSALSAGTAISDSAYISDSSAAVYNQGNLYVWNYSSGKLGPAYSQNVPSQNSFAGLTEYPVNNRVYSVDKQAGEILSFLAGKTGFSKPVVAVKDSSLNQAQDLTIGIDGSIYVLSASGVSKFQYGHLANFTTPYLSIPFSGSGKIYTQKDFKYLYVLDSGNNRILVLQKDGTLVETLKSDQFTKLADIMVDEKNKTAYVLNDGSLLKITLP